MAISGELWYSSSGPGKGSTEPAPTDQTDGDSRVGHLYSDGSHAADTATYVNSGDVFGVQLDTADNLYFALADDADASGYDTLVVGNIATGAKIGSVNIAQNGNGDTFDIINDLAVDYTNHVLYVGISGGGSGADEGIFKVTYDPHAATDNPGATGGLNPGYNAAADSPNANGALLTDTTQPGYHNGIGFQIDPTTEKLYYIDDDFEGYAGYDNGGRTNGIYVVSTTSGANPTPTLLSSQSQFPTLDGNYDSSNHVEIISMALDVAKGLIYFTTDDINDGGSSETFNLNTANDALWYMPITGGTATRVTQTSSGARLPITYPLGDNGESSFNGLTLDPNSQTLYLTDNALNGSPAKILQLQLNAAGTQATVLSSNFYSVDPSTAAEATPTDLTFAALPTLTLTGASAKPLQGGGGVTALASTPSLTDPDSNIASVTVQVTESGVVESGDVLALNGSLPGGITSSYNSANGALTLSGAATGATYATLLGEVTYQDGHTDTGAGHPARTLTWTAYDGEAGNPTDPTYNQKTTTLTIDRAPSVATHTVTVVQGGSVPTTALGDTDPDGDTLTVTAVSGGTVGTALAGTYGTLTLNGDDSYSYAADNTAAIDAAATGSHPVDSFTYTVSDGLGGTASETLQFSIDRDPTATTHPATVAEGGAAAASAGDTDPDGDALTVTALSGGTVGTALAGTYGTLTLNGDDSYSYTADDTAAIDAAATGSHPVDSFTYTVGDGLGGSTTETLQFSIDRAPLVGGLAASLDYAEGAAAATLAPAVTVSDPDGDRFGDATVSITGLQAGDVLSADTGGTSITASYDSATGVLSLLGADTAAHYQQVLESVAFAAATEDAADYTGASTRTITWTATDALGATSVSGSETVDLGVVFADTSPNVSATLDQLQAHVASLVSIQITDGQPLDITAAQDANDALALAKLVGPYELDVSGVTGQPYDAFTQSYSAQDLLTSESLSGYDPSTYGYASLTDTFDTSGRVTMQVYETSGGATVESVAITYDTDGSSMETVSGFSGQPYTSYTQSFDPSGHMTAETLSGYDQSTYGYASVEDTFDSSGRVTGQTYETSGGAVVESVSTTYNTDGGSVETVSGVTGQPYTGYSQSFDPSGHMTAETLSGYDQSTYGYASVADTFDSSGRVTGQTYETSGGAVVESVSTTYNTDGTTTESVTGVTGQPYTSYSQTLDSSGHLTAETLSGYDMSTYGYSSVMDTFDTAGRVTAQTYETSGGAVVESVAATYNTDGSSSVTYSGIQGQPYTGYTQSFDAGDHMLAEQVTDTDGSRTDYAFADGQTFLSTTVNQSQNAIGTDETFVIQPGFASVTLNGYQPGADSFDISSSLFSDFNDLIAHATPDGDSATLVTYDAQESFVILGATIAQLQSHSSDFHFV